MALAVAMIYILAHHTDVQLIVGGPLATFFEGGGPWVVHQWPSVTNPDLRLPPAYHQWSTSGFFADHSHWWTTGVMLSGIYYVWLYQRFHVDPSPQGQVY